MPPVQERPPKRMSVVMAYYDALLARAVENLPDSSPPARAALYKSTRAVLISQLQAAKRPVSIESEVRVLDEAIDRLEARLRATQDEAATTVLPDPPKPESTKSDGWQDDLLTSNNAPEVQTASEAAPDYPSLHSPEPLATPEEDKKKEIEQEEPQVDPVVDPVEISPEVVPAPPDFAQEWARRRKTPSRAPSDDVPRIQIASEAPQPEVVSDSLVVAQEWARRRKMLSLALGDEVLDVQTAPKAPPDQPQRSSEASVLKMPEGIVSRNARHRTAPSEAPAEAATEAHVSAQVWARRRKLFLVGGAIAAVFGISVGVAVVFFSGMISFPLEGAPPLTAEVPQDVSPPPASGTSNSASSQPRPPSASNENDQPISREQSDRLLQQFKQWRQKADPGPSQ